VKLKEPPRLGTLILERLGPQNDALAGDLAEEYRAGRSATWYWSQVLASIIVGGGRELWTYKWLGIHAIAAYMGIYASLDYVWSWRDGFLQNVILGSAARHLSPPALPLSVSACGASCS
jgi:hypothetical protein